jgi:hypothetical protein
MTQLWGPPLWEYLHSYSALYPRKPTLRDKIKAKKFIVSIMENLPCEICSKELQIIVYNGAGKISPLNKEILSSDMKFFRWLYHVHDYVNKNKKLKSGEIRKKSPRFLTIKKKYNKHFCFKN